MSVVTVADLGEVELVRRIRCLLAEIGVGRYVEVGPGDDAAVVGPVSGRLVLSVDSQREHVHFEREWMGPEALGYRAAAVALSDLAAMGADPGWLLLAIAAPATLPAGWVEAMVGSMAAAGRTFGAALVGGDVACVESSVALEVTASGLLPAGRDALRRDAARPGDECWVTGCPGLARAGLEVLRGGASVDPDTEVAVEAFRRPIPRLALGAALAAAPFRCAAMDTSDGLAIDVSRMCRASDVAVEIDATALHDAAVLEVAADASIAGEWALGGGEDYELLLAVAAAATPALQELCARHDVPVRRVGRFTHGEPEVRLRGRDGRFSAPGARGWSHFGGTGR